MQKIINSKPFTSVIIVAAGKGTRMKSVSDKLTTVIDGKSVLERTISAFQNSQTSDEIIIVTRTELFEELDKIKKKNNFDKIKVITEGANTRAASVICGINKLNDKAEYISIHDGARPFISSKEIDFIHSEAYKHGAVCCGNMQKYTVKEIDSDGYIHKTLDRNLLFSAATPQTFKKTIYLESLQKLNYMTDEFTDDSSIVEAAGFKVKIVNCSYNNIKITTDEDLHIAKLICKSED